MGDEAHEVGLDRLRPQHVRLEVGADAAAAGARRVRPAAGAAVDGHRAAGLLGGGVDGMKHGVAEAAVERVVDQHHLHHAQGLGVPSHLRRRHVGQLAADHDRGAEARVLAQPALDAPVIHSPRQLGREVGVVMPGDVAVVTEREDRTPEVRGREQLLEHGRVVGAGFTAVLRIRVRAHEPMWVGKAILDRERHVAGRSTVGHVLAPPLRQVLDQLGVGVPSVVDVTVDHRPRIHQISILFRSG